ncbi:MAG: hypothetical protein U5K74_07635 [Gemmatimonadaceae bacterium]|nr:hypothetical protein [Gemmatimonadaceae bacterium]
MREGWHRIGAVVRLELLIQRREPLTVLYLLVLGLLSAAFAAAGPVELVRNRGAVPRDAAWSVMLACTALTAFGQVITTMVAATVVLRDRSDRVFDLLVVSRLTAREYLFGKLLAALLMLAAIYCAIPVGLLVGALVGGGAAGAAVRAIVPPLFVLILPTMLAIGALQFAVGVLSGRLWMIVGQGLLLIWCWSASIDAVGSVTWGPLAALGDPFGSAPLLQATQTWTDLQRTTQPMPITPTLLLNRALWLAIGGALALLAIRVGASVEGHRARQAVVTARAGRREPPAVDVARDPVVRMVRPGTLRAAQAVAQYVVRWMVRDTGWRVLLVLGAVNVCAHVAVDVQGSTSSSDATARVAAAIVMHARLFLILLATIYAGEVVWREREERSAALFDVQPISDTASVAGRVIGVIIAQLLVILSLVSTAAAVAALASPKRLDLPALVSVVASRVALPFVVWMLVALAVHVVVQQKVVGHLLLIAGWVLAAVFAGAATPGEDGASAPGVWGAMVVIALAITRRGWVRGAGRATHWRRRRGRDASEFH